MLWLLLLASFGSHKKSAKPHHLTTSELRKLIDAHAAESRTCFPEGRKLSVRVHFVVNQTGHVGELRAEHKPGKEEIEACLVEKLETWSFPPPAHDLQASYTFRSVTAGKAKKKRRR